MVQHAASPSHPPAARNADHLVRMLVFFSFFLVTLRPWPNEDVFGEGIVRLTEALVLFLFMVVFILLLMNARAKVPVYLEYWLLPVILFLSIVTSLLMNTGHVTGSDLIELARPLYALSLIGIGYHGARAVGVQRFERSLLVTIVTVGVLQLPISAAQLLAPSAMDVFHTIYSDRKVEIGGLRATGTFGNPNHLAIYLAIAQIGAFCLLTGGRRWLLWVLLYTGILLTGSISLAAFSLAILLPLKIFSEGGERLTKLALYSLIGIVLFAVLLAVFTWGISLEGSHRLARLQDALQVGWDGLLALKNLRLRLHYWAQLIAIADLSNPLTVLFGSGPMKGQGLDVVDNEILFIMLRHGLLGLLVALVSLIVLARAFLGSRSRLAIFGLMVILLFVLCTPLFEMFSLWRFMPYYLIALGGVVYRRTTAVYRVPAFTLPHSSSEAGAAA